MGERNCEQALAERVRDERQCQQIQPAKDGPRQQALVRREREGQ